MLVHGNSSDAPRRKLVEAARPTDTVGVTVLKSDSTE